MYVCVRPEINPRPVPPPCSLWQHHKSISGGGFHVCGLYYEGGVKRNANVKAYCVASFEDGAPQDAGQLAIPELPEGKYWREMSAGGQHTCGIDTDRM